MKLEKSGKQLIMTSGNCYIEHQLVSTQDVRKLLKENLAFVVESLFKELGTLGPSDTSKVESAVRRGLGKIQEINDFEHLLGAPIKKEESKASPVEIPAVVPIGSKKPKEPEPKDEIPVVKMRQRISTKAAWER